jgi:hypothetical protein
MRHLGGPMLSLSRTKDFGRPARGPPGEARLQHVDADRPPDTGADRDLWYLAYDGGVEIGWHLRRASWGHRFAPEAARGCLDHGLTILGSGTISAFVETANTRSICVIDWPGMTLVRSEAGDGVPASREHATSTSTSADSHITRTERSGPPALKQLLDEPEAQ